jgi:hypothetical protein
VKVTPLHVAAFYDTEWDILLLAGADIQASAMCYDWSEWMDVSDEGCGPAATNGDCTHNGTSDGVHGGQVHHSQVSTLSSQ